MFKNLSAWLADGRKALVGVAGIAGQLLTVGLLHGTAAHVAQIIIAAATALGVFAVPNKAAARG